MRPVFRLAPSHALCAALAAAGLAAAGAPALAQTQVEEVTVVGRIGPDGQPQTLSRAVSYADLDITTKSGQDELRSRINTTARDLCRELGETRDLRQPRASCEDVAIRDAMDQMRTHVAAARPRGPDWAPGPALAAAPPEPEPEPIAPAASSAAAPASATATYTTQMVTNGPVPDTAENRRRYGQPLSRAGRMTEARGN